MPRLLGQLGQRKEIEAKKVGRLRRNRPVLTRTHEAALTFAGRLDCRYGQKKRGRE
jgi:hypothetical protein